MNYRKKFLIALVFWLIVGIAFGCAKEQPKPKEIRPTKLVTFIGSESEVNSELKNHQNDDSKIYPLTNSSGQVVNYVLVVTEKEASDK